VSTAVSVRHIRKAYAEHVAVDDVSFEIPPGVVYGLLGPNGAGKTTTIRMIMDILRPDSGSIELFGQAASAGLYDRIGYLPEERGLYKKMKVIDVLVFLGGLKGVGAAECRTRALRWLERVDLGDWRDRKVEELSKGMAQKVQFISTLLAEPELLILDEPFSGLDPVNTNQLKDLFVEVNRAGTTIVFSTHIMESAERLCRSICLINRGRVVLEGPIADIRRQHGRNNVMLEYEGDGSFLRHLDFVRGVDDYGSMVEVALNAGAEPQALLRACAERLKVRRFEVMEPSLHNIFISLVGPEAARELNSTEPALPAEPVPAGGAR
jgi:ABC-2 type transport system ATP-binding protein